MTIEKRMPTFIIGGAPRSGTTFLCHMLDKHPDVYMAKPFIPEPKVCLIPCSEGEEGYRNRYAEYFKDVKGEKALGEKSSAYLENIKALETLKMLFKDLRFLFIVREPVARAYSNYLFTKKNGFETLSFERAILAEGSRLDPFPPEMSYVRPFDYLKRGEYATFAKRYFAAFGRERVKFVLYEDIQFSSDKFYQDIQTFVQVDPLAKSLLETGVVNATDKEKFPLDKVLEAQLRERMRKEVEEFAALTGIDVGIWGY